MRRHARFLSAFGVGIGAAALAWLVGGSLGVASLVAVDAFYLAYLCLMLPLVRQGPDDLQKRAADEDEGAGLIIFLTAMAFGAGLSAVLAMIARDHAAPPLETVLALASVPLGWAMIHTLMGFHYANLYYGEDKQTMAPRGGLNFPGDPPPAMWDFLYLSFGIGMTAQVADIQVMQALRKPVLLHSIVSFFLNTVILALAVNAAVSLSG